MENTNHIEEQFEPITYYKNIDKDEIIEAYSKSQDINKKTTITVLINQKEGQKKMFLNSIEEFENLKKEIEHNKKKDNKIIFYEDLDKNGDGIITVEEIENEREMQTSDSGSDNDNTGESDTEKQLSELEKKADEIEKLGEALISSEESLTAFKSKEMLKDVDTGVLLDARMKKEKAQDEMNLTVAKYMVQKNMLVAKREQVIMEVNKEIGRGGTNLAGLQDNLIDLNNQIENLDKEFHLVLPELQNKVAEAQKEMSNAERQVMTQVKADFRNSYKQIREYTDDGILKNEKIDMTKNLNRFACSTTYDVDILSKDKISGISAQTINLNGSVVRVVSTECSHGMDTSYMDGNTTQLETGVGVGNNYISRDENGSFIADNPELADSLNKIGINSVEDIGSTCNEMKEKAENRDEEEIDEDMETTDPSLTRRY